MLLSVTLLAALSLTPGTPRAGGEPACVTTANPASLAKRASPLDSVTFRVGSATVKICYGRPSARGRTMIGGHHVPYGKVWRTGANEPTMLHTTGPITVAGIRLEPGSYSLYTVPGEGEWVVILNRSIDQWGDEESYDEKVRAREVGRVTLASRKPMGHVEQFTIRSETRQAGGSVLVLEWETSRVEMPVEAR